LTARVGPPDVAATTTRDGFIAIAALVAISAASAVFAATIQVQPGSGTLQAAIDAAAPGDTLRLQLGTYGGAITIDKSLRIIGVAGAIIGAGCADTIGVEVAADRVVLREVSVEGGSYAAVDVSFRDRVTIQRLSTFQACGTTEYTTDVVDNGTSNCWQNNTFTTGSVPASGCP
jgi:hypothetical protein